MSASEINDLLVAQFTSMSDGLTGLGMTWDSTGAFQSLLRVVIENGVYVGLDK